MNKELKRPISLILILVTLFSSALAALPMQKVMAATNIVALNPTNGFVGSRITLTGTINTTDGFYIIRWNQTLNVTTPQRATGVDVNASFTVPPTTGSPTGRNITVELIDVGTTPNQIANATFILFTKFDLQVTTPSAPRQFQEGNSTNITVSVTGGASNTVYAANVTVKDPANQTHSSIAQLSNTTTTGSGNSVKAYPSGFTGANTKYVGDYTVTSNVTAASGKFFVGLTDKSAYRLKDTVFIQATGYKPSEGVRVDIKLGTVAAASFPNRTADSGGKVTVSWAIPSNSTPGNYSVTLTNTTSTGTIKTPKDTQVFQVLGVICQILTKNLAGEGVRGITVEAYNSTAPSTVYFSGASNATGWTKFNLGAGTYTFRAFWKAKEVGLPALSNQSILTDMTLNFTVQLTDLQSFVKDSNGGVPLVDLVLSYNYTDRANLTRSGTVETSTNETGISMISNLFTNLTYVLKGSRYGLSLPGLPLQNKTSAVPLNVITIILPTYTASVSLLDAKDAPANGIRIAAYEWSSGLSNPLITETSSNGKADLSLPFGKYHLRAFADSLVINDTDLDLIEDNLNFTFSLNVLNVDVTVFVRDFFGQPVINANVTVERRLGNGDYALAFPSQLTGSDGSTTFKSVVGGDSRISAYAGGNLVGTESQFLGGAQNTVRFDVPQYVTVFGSLMAVGLFAFMVFLIIAIIIAILIVSRKRIMKFLRRNEN